MAKTTKRLLADQVMTFLKGTWPDVAQGVQQEDVYKRVEQVVNAKYKVQQFQINLPSGETIPDNLCLATYEDIDVVQAYDGHSKSTLPVMPISLPRNAGIQEIRPNISVSNNKQLGNPFIPFIQGQAFLLQADSLLNDMMGSIWYEPSGIDVIYGKDLGTYRISKVDMKLVVFDISQYSETEYLPIPSDAEDDIVKDVLKFFAPDQTQPSLVSNYPTPKINNQ